MRKNVSAGFYGDQIGYSRVVRVGNIVAVSGTAPVNADGTTAFVGDAYEQTKQCFKIMQTALEKVDARIEDAIRTRIMLTNINDWKEAARAHAEIFKDIKPVCTFVEVKGFINPEWLVEIEMDCVSEN